MHSLLCTAIAALSLLAACLEKDGLEFYFVAMRGRDIIGGGGDPKARPCKETENTL